MKTTKRKRDWYAEQHAFLERIAPEHHFHRVFDGLPGIYFFAKNKRGETLFCSPNLPTNHGLASIEEMLGKTDNDLTPGPLAVKYLSDDDEIYRTGKALPPTIEICMDHVGLPAWYRTCKYPIKDRAGRVIGIMGTFHEVISPHPDRLETESVSRATKLLEANLTTFPSAEMLSAAVGMNVRSLQRNFHKFFRMSPRIYWMKLRIRKACELISSQKLTLAQISMELGFFDQSNFTKHFRSHAGMTPKMYAQRVART